MVSLNYEKYDIVTTFVEFSKQFGKGKVRPIMITGRKGRYYIGVEITKHDPRSNYPKEYPIKDWKAAGLDYSSTIRFTKIVVLHENAIKEYVGKLTEKDIQALHDELNESKKFDDLSDKELFEILEFFM